MTEPLVRTDIVDIYVFRNGASGVELLQLRRTHAPMSHTWQPIMGHIEAGETALVAARREMNEEVGIALDSPTVLGVWALEQVHPFFMPEMNAIFLCPRLAVEVDPTWIPSLNAEHDAFRWVQRSDVPTHFMWPGQQAAISELLFSLWPADNPARQARALAQD